jgi:hypothetical protein
MSILKKILGLKPEVDFGSASRNDPCPCGSGKKYKACHWDKVQHKKRQETRDKQFINPKG